jgi:hypothetical protein
VPSPEVLTGEKALAWDTGGIDVADLVFLAYMHTSDDAARLADMLFTNGRDEYEERIRQELAKLGCSDEGVYLREEGELSWLRSHCDQVSVGVTGTYNRDLRNAIDNIIADWLETHDGSLKGLNRNVVSARVRAWDEERGIWKAQQISTTEMGVVDDRAVLRFAELNSADYRARVMPENASCNLCQSYVAMGWLPAARAETIFDLPAHVNCIHSIETELQGVPDCADLWRGGTLKGLGPEEWAGKERGWFADNPTNPHVAGAQGIAIVPTCQLVSGHDVYRASETDLSKDTGRVLILKIPGDDSVYVSSIGRDDRANHGEMLDALMSAGKLDAAKYSKEELATFGYSPKVVRAWIGSYHGERSLTLLSGSAGVDITKEEAESGEWQSKIDRIAKDNLVGVVRQLREAGLPGITKVEWHREAAPTEISTVSDWKSVRITLDRLIEILEAR